MQTIELPNLADELRTLPTEGTARNRQLYNLIDSRAAEEANAALRDAAGRAIGQSGVLAGVITSAAGVLAGDGTEQDRLREVIASPEFLSRLPEWVRELRELAASHPDTGACTLGSALELWSWTLRHFRTGAGSEEAASPEVIDELAEVLCPLLAARAFAFEVAASTGPTDESKLRTDLCRVHAARTASSLSGICAEIVFGYRRHLVWDAEGCAACYAGEDLDDLEALIPGIASGARMSTDVVEADGSHPGKAGPCASFEGMDSFIRLRNRLDGCLTGARIARDRAAVAMKNSMTDTASGGRA